MQRSVGTCACRVIPDQITRRSVVGLNKCDFTAYEILGLFGPLVFSVFLPHMTICLVLGPLAFDLPKCQEP